MLTARVFSDQELSAGEFIKYARRFWRINKRSLTSSQNNWRGKYRYDCIEVSDVLPSDYVEI